MTTPLPYYFLRRTRTGDFDFVRIINLGKINGIDIECLFLLSIENGAVRMAGSTEG